MNSPSSFPRVASGWDVTEEASHRPGTIGSLTSRPAAWSGDSNRLLLLPRIPSNSLGWRGNALSLWLKVCN